LGPWEDARDQNTLPLLYTNKAIKVFNLTFNGLRPLHGRRSGPPVEKIHIASNDRRSVVSEACSVRLRESCRELTKL
jgi:hypothetical protein